jgi:hypothetical protein
VPISTAPTATRPIAGSLAGLSGWAASIALQGAPNGKWLSLLCATVVTAALLTAFVQTHGYVFAVIGCAMLLSIWRYRCTGSLMTPWVTTPTSRNPIAR